MASELITPSYSTTAEDFSATNGHKNEFVISLKSGNNGISTNHPVKPIRADL